MHRNMQCSRREWAVSLLYSEWTTVLSASGNRRWYFISRAVLLLLPAVFISLGALVYEPISILAIPVFVYLLWKLVKRLRYQPDDRWLRAGAIPQEIDYARMDEAGLQLTMSVSPVTTVRIPWSRVSRVAFAYTRAGQSYKAKVRLEMLKAKFAAAIPELADLVLEGHEDDRYSLYFYTPEQKTTELPKLNQLQLPASWIYNGRCRELIEGIRHYAGVPVEAYDEQSVHYGLFAGTGGGKDARQAKLEQTFQQMMNGW